MYENSKSCRSVSQWLISIAYLGIVGRLVQKYLHPNQYQLPLLFDRDDLSNFAELCDILLNSTQISRNSKDTNRWLSIGPFSYEAPLTELVGNVHLRKLWGILWIPFCPCQNSQLFNKCNRWSFPLHHILVIKKFQSVHSRQMTKNVRQFCNILLV